MCFALFSLSAVAQNGGELRFCLRTEPKTFDPFLVDDDSSLSIRYLTGGVLSRVNRHTQELEPELAESWKVSPDGKQITFKLRHGVHFSDGTPFSADDVAFTMKRLMDPALHSPVGDEFRAAGNAVTTKVIAPDQVSITFPGPIVGIDRLFDELVIVSAHSSKKEAAVLGPFMVAEYKPGSSVRLERNPYYWKKDAQGRRLPYLDSIHIDIQPNRDVEMLRFKRGELDLINISTPTISTGSLQPRRSSCTMLAPRSIPTSCGSTRSRPLPSPNTSAPGSAPPISAVPSPKLSIATTLARIVYNGHAQPAVGPVSPANKYWFNANLKPEPHNPQAALDRLKADGFHMQNGALLDKSGNPVEFSIVTNAGSKPRERMGVLIQEDLGKIGIKVNLVTLDFPSLIERISQKFNYEAAILGFRNVDLDPNGQMNIWMSSAENHAWNPQQKSPETAWEAEIDKLMRAQAATSDSKKRKQSFDRVQEIVYEQAPFIYLVNLNALSAISTSVAGANSWHPLSANVLERRAPDAEWDSYR